MNFMKTIIAQGPNTVLDISNEKVREGVNRQLDYELSDMILSPESGVQTIRKVLARFGVDMPALYGLEPEGDEVVIDLTEDRDDSYYLYFIYALTDDNRYEFYAEIVDEAGLNEIESDEEEDEDTE